jgi:hypothetical protein
MSLSAPASPRADDIYKKIAVAAAVLAVMFEAAYLVTSAPPYDRFGYLIGRDFVNTWMGANSAFSGGPAAWFGSAWCSSPSPRGSYGGSKRRSAARKRQRPRRKLRGRW